MIPTKRGYRKQMMQIWREIEIFEVSERRLEDQGRGIRTNGSLSEMWLNEIQRKIKEEENMKEPKIELQNTSDQQRSQDDDDELTKN